MPKELPPIYLLRKLLRYEPDTGKMFWLERTPNMFANTGKGGARGCCARWNSKNAEKLALNHLNSHGYFAGRIFGDLYLAHRVAWAMCSGQTLFEQIDHQNGIRTDNRIHNLRCVSNCENTKNAKIRLDNKSGITGIRKQGRLWVAQIGGSKNRKHLGSFSKLEEAILAREKAKKELEYHQNHGAR